MRWSRARWHVADVDSLGTIGVRWDNGSNIDVITSLDQFDIISLDHHARVTVTNQPHWR